MGQLAFASIAGGIRQVTKARVAFVLSVHSQSTLCLVLAANSLQSSRHDIFLRSVQILSIVIGMLFSSQTLRTLEWHSNLTAPLVLAF